MWFICVETRPCCNNSTRSSTRSCEKIKTSFTSNSLFLTNAVYPICISSCTNHSWLDIWLGVCGSNRFCPCNYLKTLLLTLRWGYILYGIILSGHIFTVVMHANMRWLKPQLIPYIQREWSRRSAVKYIESVTTADWVIERVMWFGRT